MNNINDNICEAQLMVSENHQVDSAFINDVDTFNDESIPNSLRSTENTNNILTSGSDIRENQVESRQAEETTEFPNSRNFIKKSDYFKMIQEKKKQIQESKKTETKKEIPKVIKNTPPPTQKILSKRVDELLYILYQDLDTKDFLLKRYTMTNPRIFPFAFLVDKNNDNEIIEYNEPLPTLNNCSQYNMYFQFLKSQKSK